MNKLEIEEAIILCGGKGTRLLSAVSDRPKSMATVAGQPFLTFIIDDLVSKGIQRIILSTGYKSQLIEEYIKTFDSRVEIVIEKEDTPLGTGGAVKSALKLINSENVLVLNGDSFCYYDLNKLLKFHLSKHALISILASRVKDSAVFGTMNLDNQGKILCFNEKAYNGCNVVNAGVYIFSNKAFDKCQFDAVFSLEKDFFPDLVGEKFYGFETKADFLDIGTPENYSQAKQFLPPK